jgi:hypothetical protein
MTGSLPLEIVLPVIALLLWGAFVVRVYRKVSRDGAWLVGFFYLIADVGASLLLWKPIGLVASLTFGVLFAAMPWLATGFKPEFMIDPKELYPEDKITKVIRSRTGRSQLIGLGTVFLEIFLVIRLAANFS